MGGQILNRREKNFFKILISATLSMPTQKKAYLEQGKRRPEKAMTYVSALVDPVWLASCRDVFIFFLTETCAIRRIVGCVNLRLCKSRRRISPGPSKEKGAPELLLRN